MVVAAANVRGTAIKIGNLPGTRSISAGAQLDATAARLRKAEASGDAIEILASMQAATALELPQGVNPSPEVVDAMRERNVARPQMKWEAPGIGIVIPVPAAISKAWNIPISLIMTSNKTGNGPNVMPHSRRSFPISITSPIDLI